MLKAAASEQSPVPGSMGEFAGAFMHAINTARLYSSGHDILAKHIADLHTKFLEALGDLDFLFLGCGRNRPKRKAVLMTAAIDWMDCSCLM